MANFAELILTADTRGLKRGERDLESLTKTGARTERQADRTGVSLGRMGQSMKAAGIAAVAGIAAMASFGAVVRQVSEFDSSMSRLGAVSRATSGELIALRDVAKDLGSSTEFSATQAADGLNFLAMAGFSVSESMAAIPAVLDLATASGMGLAAAADTASNIMSGFGIEAQNAANVSDVLAAASTRANTDVSQLGQAMSTVAPIAAALEIGLEDTAAAIGVLSDAGIQGARAGTAMRGVLASLAGPTGEAVEVLQRLGLTIGDIDPAANELSVVMGRLGEAGLSTADAMTLFGREAASGALVLIDGAERLGEFGDELRNVDGAAGDMAATMRDNLGGDIKGLQSAVSGLILAMGDAGLTAILRGVVGALTAVARAVTFVVDGLAFVRSKVSDATNALFGFGQTAGQTSAAIDNITLAMRDEVNALDVLMGQIPAGTEMSRQAAQAKLEEARAIYAKIEAGNEEARQAVIQSEAYRASAAMAAALADQIYEIKVAQEDAAMAGAALPAHMQATGEMLAIMEDRLQSARAAQQDLLDAAAPMPDEALQAANAISQIETALANATGQQVVFVEGTGAAIVTGERLSATVGGINFGSAIGGAEALAQRLGVSLSLAMQIAATAGTSNVGDEVFDPRSPRFNASAQDAANRAAELADIRASFEALPAIDLNFGGGSGSSGGGGSTASAINSQTKALRDQIEALEDAANPMREFNRGMAELDELQKLGLSDGAYALAVQELRDELAAATPEVKTFGSVFMDGMSGAMDYVLNGFKNGWAGILDIIKRSLLDAVKFALANPVNVQMGVTGGIGGIGGGGGISGVLQSALGGFGGSGGIMGALTGGGGLAAGMSGLAGGTGILGGLGNTLAGTFGTGGSIGGLVSSIGGGAGILSSIGAALPMIGIAAAVFSFFKKKTTILDEGIRATIDMESAMFESFQKIQTTRFWGLSKKTSIKYKDLSDDESAPFNDAVFGVQESVIGATDALGISADIFEGFTHQFSVSLKGLDDAAKEAAVLEALEGLGDAMAEQVTGLDEFTLAGEGAFEALTRLSTSLVTVNDVFRDLGFNLYNVSLAGADGAAAFADLFGSLDNFTSATAAYYDQFYTDTEKLTNATARLSESLGDLGINVLPTTNAAFRDLVETAMLAGDSDLAASLIQLAPAFDTVTDATAALRASLNDLSEDAFSNAFDYRRAMARADNGIAYAAQSGLSASDNSNAVTRDEFTQMREVLERIASEVSRGADAGEDQLYIAGAAV